MFVETPVYPLEIQLLLAKMRTGLAVESDYQEYYDWFVRQPSAILGAKVTIANNARIALEQAYGITLPGYWDSYERLPEAVAAATGISLAEADEAVRREVAKARASTVWVHRRATTLGAIADGVG